MQREYLATGAVLAAILAAATRSRSVDCRVPSLFLLVSLVAVFVFVPGAWPTLYRTTGVGVGAWLLATVVAGGGVALGYATGDPRPFCEGTAIHRGCLTAFGWASVIYLASALALAVGVGHLGRYRQLRDGSAEPARKVSDGVVAVEGRDRSGHQPGSRAGLRGADRVVPERRRKVDAVRGVPGGRPRDRRHRVLRRGRIGRLLVLPDALDDHDVAALARSRTDDEGRRRHREWSYRPDDAVTVVGDASEVSRGDCPEPVVVGLEGPVVVGLRSLAELRGRAARRAILGSTLAVVFGGGAPLVLVLRPDGSDPHSVARPPERVGVRVVAATRQSGRAATR